jgi:hypothetical protein
VPAPGRAERSGEGEGLLGLAGSPAGCSGGLIELDLGALSPPRRCSDMRIIGIVRPGAASFRDQECSGSASLLLAQPREEKPHPGSGGRYSRCSGPGPLASPLSSISYRINSASSNLSSISSASSNSDSILIE